MNSIIALSGMSRCGKDTFCKITERLLLKQGIKSQRVALADELKNDLDPFLLEKTGISALTPHTPEKNMIRDLMVAYGKIKRLQSNGTYWTNLAEKKIQVLWEQDIVPIVTDVRYDFYDHDEVFWAKEKMNGVLVHITRYENVHSNEFGVRRVYFPAPNKEEAENDPKLKAKADFEVEWETSINPFVCPEEDTSLVLHGQQFMNWYKDNVKFITV